VKYRTPGLGDYSPGGGGRCTKVPIAQSSVPAGRPSLSLPHSLDMIDGLAKMHGWRAGRRRSMPPCFRPVGAWAWGVVRLGNPFHLARATQPALQQGRLTVLDAKGLWSVWRDRL